MLDSIINLKDYTLLEHGLFFSGCVMWVITYLIVIKSIRSKRFIEIPLIAVCANFAWEFLWSFIFETNMGELYVWGYRLWFFLDCYILFNLFKYGYKQIDIPTLKNKAQLIIAFGLACWGVMLFYYIQNYDFPLSQMGAFSGYILNVMMSALYITTFLRLKNDHFFSKPAAWLKGVGTFLITIFIFLKFPEYPFLLSMCVITAILDFAYIYLINRK